MESRKVLVVEDESLLRELIGSALKSEGFEVAMAADSSAARAIIESQEIDAAILDVDLGQGPNGFDLGQVIRKVSPTTALVFLTGLPDPRFADRAIGGRSRDVAYLRKSALAELSTLVTALEAALRGEVTSSHRHDLDPERPLRQLTQNQIAVLTLMSEGKSNAQIAAARGVTVKAVEDTIRRACVALRVDPSKTANTRVAAVREFVAMTGGVISAESG